METIRLTVTSEEAGQRADSLLARRLEGLTRSAAARLLEEGRVTDRGRPAAKNLRVQPGQVLEVQLPEPEEPEARPQNIPLDVVYEDRDVIVVNKPTGMVVHPAPGHPDGTLVNALLYHCGDSLSGIGGQKRPGIVHRIDRDTSGLIIAAKNDAAHLALAAQLADHTLARTYECLAVGNFREDSGTVDAPIGRHPVDRKRMAVVRQGGREAVTHWEVIARYPGVTHLRCRLETGRTHQIRVHLAYIGHPILGDTVYGAKKPVAGLTGQCLHAVGLRFIHPRTGEPVELTCPRTYECLAVGNFREDSGTVDAPIGRHPVDRKRMAVVRQGGREAVTHWEVIARYPGVTHLRCRLETGRTHQIRVHLAYIGHPILGDTVYGAKKPVAGLTGQCLHAVGLRFIHPRTGEPVELTCPLPEEFVRMLEKLRRNM